MRTMCLPAPLAMKSRSLGVSLTILYRRSDTGRFVTGAEVLGTIPITLSEVLTELHRSQESAYNIRDAGRQDHLHRAKICSKIVKYPHIEDYAVRKTHLVLADG